MAEHSKLLSPSASHLWLKCTAMPQAVIDAGLKDQAAGADADLGTLKHKYSEQMFLGKLDPKGAKPGDLSDEDWNEVIIGVHAAKHWLKDYGDDAIIITERKLKFKDSFRKDDGFGTGDIVAYSRQLKRLGVGDYKYGRVRVNPINPQLDIYAVAALQDLAAEYPEVAQAETYETAIFQPKISHGHSSYLGSVAELRKWDQLTLAPTQQSILNGLTEFVPGPHCGEHYCKLQRAGKCSKLNQDIDGLIDDLFNVDLTPKAIPSRDNLQFFLKLMRYESTISKMISTAFAVATEMKENGEDVPGFKLVLGKSNRQWKDEEKAEEFLKKKGIVKDKRFKSTLISAPQAETLLKKEGKLDRERSVEEFNALIEKPTPKKILVPDTDPREEVSFANVDDVIDDLFDLNPDNSAAEEKEADDFLDSLLSGGPDVTEENVLDDDLLSLL